MTKTKVPDPSSLKRRRRQGVLPVGGKALEKALEQDRARQEAVESTDSPVSSITGLIRFYQDLIEDRKTPTREKLAAAKAIREIRRDEEQIYTDIRHWPSEKLVEVTNRLIRLQLMRMGLALTSPFLRCQCCDAEIDLRARLKEQIA